jgi:hypothetical protein
MPLKQRPHLFVTATSCPSPVVMYHGLACRYLIAPRFLMRPLLNGGTLGRPRSERNTLASSLPIVRQIAWLSLLPQLVVMAGMVAAARALRFHNPFLAAAVPYFLLSLILSRVIPTHHRAGMRLFKQERFAEAIPKFQESYSFFVKHPWLDRWRAIFLLSAGRISYREMALLNVAFCLAQSGQRTQSLAAYKRTLAEFPDSKMAQTAIRMIDDVGDPTGSH